MKRFWTTADAVGESGGWSIQLDGRPVRTPARRTLTVPSEALARAIVAEWDVQGETIEPRSMPLTGLANAAIDRVAPDPDSFAASLARYGESDLLCYRAEGPSALVARQAEPWDSLLGWARRRFDIDIETCSGVIHQPQADATIARLAHAVAALGPFELAGLSPLVTIGGSLIAALAVLENARTVDEAWAAVTVDEAWQAEQWGNDAEAEVALGARRDEFFAGARFLDLLAA